MITRSLLRPFALPFALALALLIFWNTFLVYPLKIFVVFLHEISHGLAAIMTGGTIEQIELTFDQGGACLTRGGSAFLILSAGYLGSSLWGALLLVLSSRTRWSRLVVLAIGGLTLAITIFFVRSLFGVFYGLCSGTLLIIAGQKLQQKYCELLVKVIGITSSLYAIYDIASDVFANPIRQSDAHALAELTGIPALVWGLFWIVLAIGMAGLALILSRGRYVRL